MPTFYFFLYLAAVAGAYFFKLTYIGWFGGYLLAVTALLPPLLLLLSLPSMFRLHATFTVPEHCARDAEAWLRVRFRAGRLLPLSRVKLSVRLENQFTGEKTSLSYVYRGLVDGDCLIPLPTGSCGLVRCRVTGLRCYDLLGLISLRRRCGEESRYTVLPRPAEPEKRLDIDAAMNANAVLRPKYGGGYSEEHDLRVYQPGDSVNSIHWKLSSKTGNTIVREPLMDANTQVYLVLAGAENIQEGLETLYWLSLELCRLEIAHTVIGAGMYEVTNETETRAAMATLLSAPWSGPCPFNRALARCVFLVSGREVKAL